MSDGTKIIYVALRDDQPDNDHRLIFAHLQAIFPHLVVLEGDQLQREVKSAEEMECPPEKERVRKIVVASLRRKAETYGPAIAFRIGTPIWGTVRRRDMTFFIESEPDPQTMKMLLEFADRSRATVEIL